MGLTVTIGYLEKLGFLFKIKARMEIFRRHIVDMSRIKFSCATQSLGKKTFFHGSLDFYHTLCGNQVIGIFKISDL